MNIFTTNYLIGQFERTMVQVKLVNSQPHYYSLVVVLLGCVGVSVA